MSIFLTRFSAAGLGPAASPLLSSVMRAVHPSKAANVYALRYFSSGVGGRGDGDKKSSADDESITIENADGPYDAGYHESDDRFDNAKPTLAYAKSMPTSFSSMRHEQILQLSAEGIPEARAEALIRNIMGVDSIDYDDAKKILKEMAKSNRKGVALHLIPQKVGLFGALFAGFVSIPMVFDFNTVHTFNEMFVTADVPEPKDLETWLEVGSWSWAWMEPLIGQASFLLLTMQFARAQLQNLGMMPYSDYMRNMRAKRLIKQYPRYNPDFVAAFSMSDRGVYPSQFKTLSILKND